eukprot:TRINITY_DN43_c3_g1_i1.p1 TRINITY_DN43_c3_g1~~TRINITY_DN43_c3_g1_i1.p1  ORF type:complete len:426 (+),score=42.88 TRINITY_DN43_c3_g1_i1:55-1278(+)
MDIGTSDKRLSLMEIEQMEVERIEADEKEQEIPAETQHADLDTPLLKVPIVLFGTPLGLLSQSSLYSNIRKWRDDGWVGMAAQMGNWGFWGLGLASLFILGCLYLAKIIRYNWAVRQEWYDPVRSNFMFAPIIAVLLAILGTPKEVENLIAMEAAWWTCVVAYSSLALPLYQSWLRKEHRTLQHGNPTHQIAVVSNFLLALVGFNLGYTDVPFAFLSIGLVFQTTVFISLFTSTRRGPKDDGPDLENADVEAPEVCFPCISKPSSVRIMPDDQLNPTMFLFVAPPSVCSLAVSGMLGTFDNYLSRGALSLALFLYAMQVISPRVFAFLVFTPSWWAYTFPVTAAATASVAFARARPSTDVPDVIAVTLTIFSTLCVLVVFFRTLYSLVRCEYLKCDTLLKVPQRNPY